MRKVHRDMMLSGIASAILVTIIYYLMRGEVPWVYLFTFPLFSFILNFYMNKRREAKKEEEDQRKELIE